MNRNQNIQILITLNQAYLPRLQVMLTSMHSSQPDEKFDIWLLHNSIPEESLEPVTCQCRALGYAFHPVTVDSAAFTGAPVSRQYPREMYYRLLAPFLLPRRLHRILYLDPDILVINPLRPLWETDLKGNLFAAASHTGKRSWRTISTSSVSGQTMHILIPESCSLISTREETRS